MIVTVLLLCVFVFVQSIYGVGLLVFGTPTLLLMGHSFDDALGLLLPSSLAISSHQIIASHSSEIDEVKLIPIAILGTPIGLLLTMKSLDETDLSVQMGCIMLVAALIRSNQKMQKSLSDGLKRARLLFHFLNAIFHGMTNLGGAFLPIYSNSVYSEKIRAVRCTALFYVVYAVAQITTLVVIGKYHSLKHGLMLLPVLLLFYWVAGQRSFKVIADQTFYLVATFFLWSMAAAFLFRATL